MEKYCTAGQDTDDNITRRMRIAYCTTKTTDTHSEYVIIVAFPRQQWLRERASMLKFICSLTVLLPLTCTVLSRSVANSRKEVAVQYISLLATTLLRHKSATRPSSEIVSG